MTIAQLDEPFAEKTARQSPFDIIACCAGRHVAEPLAAAFAASYQVTDVWAALRFHKLTSREDLHAWLVGRVFAKWQNGHDRDMSDLAVQELRELAGKWLEGR